MAAGQLRQAAPTQAHSTTAAIRIVIQLADVQAGTATRVPANQPHQADRAVATGERAARAAVRRTLATLVLRQAVTTGVRQAAQVSRSYGAYLFVDLYRTTLAIPFWRSRFKDTPESQTVRGAIR